MKSIKTLKEELREIKHYYSQIDELEKVGKVIGAPQMMIVVEMYNKKILNAPIRLYSLYVSLYLKNKPQNVVADEWGVSLSQIALLSKKLNEFLIEEFNKEV